jgi:hypothetical protein
MRTLISTALALAALAAPGLAQGNFDFQLDQAASAFSWSGTTSLGDINENPANFNLAGNSIVTMAGGGNPVGSGAFPGGGAASTVPSVIGGEIPNVLPFLPPLATLNLSGAQFRISGGNFAVDGAGGFSATVVLSFTAGTLTVAPLTGGTTQQSLAGNQSSPTQVNGSLTYDGTRYRISAPINGVFAFADPGTGTSGSITLNGTVVAFHTPVAPAVYCSSNANSTGGAASMSFGGTTSLGAGNPSLDVNGLPTNTFGIVFYGAGQTNSPFGDGVRCVGGQVQRLAPQNSGAFGSISRGIGAGDLAPTSPATVGQSLNFQFWYRDVPAGGAGFNTSDALTVRYTP